MADSNTGSGIIGGLIGLALLAGVVYVLFYAGAKGMAAGKSNG